MSEVPTGPPIPYCRQTLGEAETRAILEVLESGWIARGPKSREFEARCAERLQASHAVSCANGSAALEIALRGLGIGPGDEVIVPTLTWVATAMAVRLVGATPVFADVDPVTHNLTPESARARWSDRTRAVIAVDMAGVPCPAHALRALAEERSAFLIQDAAHSFGAAWSDGTPVGSDGPAHATTFSFHPAKTITTGEGGLVTTADPELADRLRRIRSGGITRDFSESRGAYDYLATDIGSNYHLTELQAALGLAQLDRLDDLLERRRRAAARLLEELRPLEGLLLPKHPSGSSWNLFIVEIPDADGERRDRVLGLLRERGVHAHVHYPLLHRQPVFGFDGDESGFEHADRYFRGALTLPLFADIEPHQIARVARALEEVLELTVPTPTA